MAIELPVDFGAALADIELHPVVVGLRVRFRRVTERAAVLVHGPAGWGEWSPFPEYDDAYAARWLAAAIEAAIVGFPPALRSAVPVNATVPALPAAEVGAFLAGSPARTVKVKVAEPGQSHGDDLDRVAAVRDHLGAGGAIRVDANGAWTLEEAARHLPDLDRAAGGLQYAEQPVATLADMAELRRRVTVPLAVDESIRTAHDPARVAAAGAADYLVVKAQPLGGVRRTLDIVEQVGLPAVVSSALETSVGLSAGLALAAALPALDLACGLGTATLLAQDVTADPLLAGLDGSIRVRSVAPDPDLLDALRPPEPVASAMLARLRAAAAAATDARYL